MIEIPFVRQEKFLRAKVKLNMGTFDNPIMVEQVNLIPVGNKELFKSIYPSASFEQVGMEAQEIPQTTVFPPKLSDEQAQKLMEEGHAGILQGRVCDVRKFPKATPLGTSKATEPLPKMRTYPDEMKEMTGRTSADITTSDSEAPYGRKADGTPRKIRKPHTK